MGKNRCELCGKFYKTYAIILCDNPICFASFLSDEVKEDNSFRAICESCRNKIDKGNRGKKMRRMKTKKEINHRMMKIFRNSDDDSVGLNQVEVAQLRELKWVLGIGES